MSGALHKARSSASLRIPSTIWLTPLGGCQRAAVRRDNAARLRSKASNTNGRLTEAGVTLDLTPCDSRNSLQAQQSAAFFPMLRFLL